MTGHHVFKAIPWRHPPDGDRLRWGGQGAWI